MGREYSARELLVSLRSDPSGQSRHCADGFWEGTHPLFGLIRRSAVALVGWGQAATGAGNSGAQLWVEGDSVKGFNAEDRSAEGSDIPNPEASSRTIQSGLGRGTAGQQQPASSAEKGRQFGSRLWRRGHRTLLATDCLFP